MTNDSEIKNNKPFLEFREYLKNIKELWAWAAGAAVVPFLANFVKLAPPWPPAIVYLTAVFELVAVVWAYQTAKRMSLAKSTALMKKCIIFLCFFLTAYLFLLSTFTIEIPGTGKVLTKGIVCTDIAAAQYSNCPWLVGEDMAKAEWDPLLLWSIPSISLVRILIVFAWLATFFSLSLFLGSFLVRLRDSQ